MVERCFVRLLFGPSGSGAFRTSFDRRVMRHVPSPQAARPSLRLGAWRTERPAADPRSRSRRARLRGGALADQAVVTPFASVGAPATTEAGRPGLDSRRSLRHRANVGSPHDASGDA